MGTKSVLVNQECTVRDRPCNRVFGASNTCFIASPFSEEVAFELEILKIVLLEEDIDPYIAVEHFEPAKDIFCSKICTKIIESKLCIAVLSGDTDDNGVTLPNPNVYYEYGLMTAWGKPIIPIQRHDQKLAFNIQSLDTIKYNPSDFKNKIAHAIRLTLTNIEKQSERDTDFQLRNIVTCYMEMCGYKQRKDHWSVEATGYTAFDNFQYATLVTSGSEKDRLRYETRMIIRRLEQFLSTKERQKRDVEDLMKPDMKPKTLLKYKESQRRLEWAIEGSKKPTFTIVVADRKDRDEIEGIEIGETVLQPVVMIITLEEIKNKIEGGHFNISNKSN